ncbi:hypothetical protein Avbf_14222 [Armadillidium vulgare]|nr:hypothetical protein Avbf_14222 [Armadillidium vulgare]
MNDKGQQDPNNLANQAIANLNQYTTIFTTTITTTTITTTTTSDSNTNTNVSQTGTKPKSTYTIANFNTNTSNLHANISNKNNMNDDSMNNVHRPTGGIRGNVWSGLDRLWVSLLNNLFRDEHIYTDIGKLAAYPRFLEPNGSARSKFLLKAEDTDPSLSPITNSKFSGQNIHTSFNSKQFSNYIQVDYETDIDEDDHIDFISCNSNCSYTNANTIPHYNDSSAMNSKHSYQAINRKAHKTLNTLLAYPVTINSYYSYTYPNIAFLDGDIDPISESKSQTTESSDYFSNAKLQKDNQISFGDSHQCLKQHFRTSSQAFSRKENTTKQNSKFQSSQNSYHPQILPDSYSYPKTFHNRSLQPQTLQNSSHSQTYSYPKTFQNSSPQPQTLQNSSHSQTYSYPKILHNNSPSNSSPSPMMKDNRQTDPSYKPHPLYKNSQNISQMRLRNYKTETFVIFFFDENKKGISSYLYMLYEASIQTKVFV